MTSFNADNSDVTTSSGSWGQPFADNLQPEELNIELIDNKASIPYTDVIIDCDGSMAQTLGKFDKDNFFYSRTNYSLLLLYALYNNNHITNNTLIHGFDSHYLGCIPFRRLMGSRYYHEDFELKKNFFKPAEHTEKRSNILSALSHVTNIDSTLAIFSLWKKLTPIHWNDRESQKSNVPYDCICYPMVE